VLQHGWDHANHELPGRPEAELSRYRETAEVLAQLVEGRRRLGALFADRVFPVLVPPHNRMSPHLGKMIASLYRFVSVYADFPGLGIPSRNIHVDIIEWPTMETRDPRKVVSGLVAALRLRRWGVLPRSRPIGILSHHLMHNESMWSFLARLLDDLRGHPAVAFRPAREIFG